MKLGLFFRVTHQSKVHTIIYQVLNASNLTNQYISYSMALFSANEIQTFFVGLAAIYSYRPKKS